MPQTFCARNAEWGNRQQRRLRCAEALAVRLCLYVRLEFASATPELGASCWRMGSSCNALADSR